LRALYRLPGANAILFFIYSPLANGGAARRFVSLLQNLPLAALPNRRLSPFSISTSNPIRSGVPARDRGFRLLL
jgi:hypothetical protein